MKTYSFKKLCKEYQGRDRLLVEITSVQEAKNQIASKTSPCWGAGQKMGESGWIQLASPSPQSKNDKKVVFVCRASLIEK